MNNNENSGSESMIAKRDKLQSIYNSYFNYTLLSDPNGYPEIEEIKFPEEDVVPYDPSWLVSDDTDVVKFSQKGSDDASNTLENIAEVHRINDGIAK